ncbi:MAG: CHRD domain-containing protein, partial [bacterium]
CDDNPAGPSNPPLVFSAVLSPANEVPPIGNAESTGVGAVQVTFNTTAGTATFYFQLSGFPGSITVVGAHIHPGAAGVNGPVIINTGLTNLAVPNGTVEFTSATVTVTPALVQSIVDNPAAFYFNVHSPLNPGGFARGQLRRVQ